MVFHRKNGLSGDLKRGSRNTGILSQNVEHNAIFS